MTKNLCKKLKYLENEKNFSGEIKSIFHHFYRALNEAKNTIFLEGESPDLRSKKVF